MTATLVTLVDGRIVQSDADEWRHQCLANHVLSKPLAERREWLADFEQKHGAADTQALKDTIAALHAKARA